MLTRRCLPLLLACVLLQVGCAAYTTTNPSYDLSVSEARDQLREMKKTPVVSQRPLVFVGPFFDPFIAQWYACSTYDDYFSDDNMIGVSFTLLDNFDSCRRKVLKAVDQAYPTDNPDETIEVDVLSFSMGGVVARYAALAPDPERGQTRRLKINRLFSVSSPHQGANWAPLGLFHPLTVGMQTDSEFLHRLDAALTTVDYEIIAYTRLGDWIVGESKTAPPTQDPIWVSNRPFDLSHLWAPMDPRIRADILSRLRGEPPLASSPPAPLP